MIMGKVLAQDCTLDRAPIIPIIHIKSHGPGT